MDGDVCGGTKPGRNEKCEKTRTFPVTKRSFFFFTHLPIHEATYTCVCTRTCCTHTEHLQSKIYGSMAGQDKTITQSIAPLKQRGGRNSRDTYDYVRGSPYLLSICFVLLSALQKTDGTHYKFHMFLRDEFVPLIAS